MREEEEEEEEDRGRGRKKSTGSDRRGVVRVSRKNDHANFYCLFHIYTHIHIHILFILLPRQQTNNNRTNDSWMTRSVFMEREGDVE